MRIGKSKFAQLVESTPPVLVVVDDNEGVEVQLTPSEVIRLLRAIEYFGGALGVGVTTISAALRDQSDVLVRRANDSEDRFSSGLRLAASTLRVRAAQVEHELLLAGEEERT